MSKSLLGLEASNAIVVGAGQGGGREIGSESISIAADATDATSVAEMLARTRGELGPVRTAVNNVGSYGSHRPAGFVDLEWDFWQTAIDLNVKSTFLCSRECARSMQDAGVDGAIVNIAVSATQCRARSTGLSATSSMSLGRYFTAPNARPRIMWRCSRKTTTIMGTSCMTTVALIVPHKTV